MALRESSPPARIVTFGAFRFVLNETFFLILGLLLSALAVALLVFAPMVFVGPYNGKPYGPGGYVKLIGDLVHQLASGQLTTNKARNTQAWKELFTATQRTVQLIGISAALALVIGTAWGFLLANVRRQPFRALITGANTLLLAIPTFVLLMLAIELVANITLRTGIQLAYVHGYGLDKHLVLPAAVLVLRSAAYYARALEIAYEETMRQEWVQAARARGFGGWRLLLRHVLPALRIPMLGGLLSMLRMLVGWVIIVEYMVSWGGLGQRMLNFKAFWPQDKNYQTGIVAVLIMTGLFVLLDALAELALRAADPRLREEE